MALITSSETRFAFCPAIQKVSTFLFWFIDSCPLLFDESDCYEALDLSMHPSRDGSPTGWKGPVPTPVQAFEYDGYRT